MVLTRLLPIVLMLLLASTSLRAEERAGEVVLPLKDYLALVEAGEAAQRTRQERVRQQAAPLAEVVSQRVAAVLEDGEARVTSEFEVLVQGRPDKPVALPLAGYPATVEVLRDGRPAPGAAVSALSNGRGGVLLVAPEAGRYSVKILGRARVENLGGIGRLTFPPAAAPVSVTEVDLPAETSWTAPGGVVVEEREQGGRRTVSLASKRGETQVLELKRRFDSADAERLLAQAVQLTIVQLRPEGVRRHDVVLYEVSRGNLPSFTVTLPDGVVAEQVGTDEGPAVPGIESEALTVHRHRQLQGTGYLVVTSTPVGNGLPGEMSLEPAVPAGVDVRSRYFALASSVAAEARPLPEASWARVDLEDLPPSLSEALEVIDLAAAWRATGSVESGVQLAHLAIQALPPVPGMEVPVRQRDTTTLLTVDGTLLHRDRFTLGPVTRPGAALDVTLPAGAILWSARVGDQPVRPLNRNGRVTVPLGFTRGMETEVEVVSVVERAIPGGRSQLGLELPQLSVPVLEHHWRVLLPEGNRYRFRSGNLRPAPPPMYRAVRSKPASTVGGTALVGVVTDDQGSPLPGVTITLSPQGSQRLAPVVQVSDANGMFRFVGITPASYELEARLEGFSSVEIPNIRVTSGRTVDLEVTLSSAVEDVITVTAESPLLDERRISTGATVHQTELDQRSGYFDFKAVEELRQGLVGGVRPLPVVIPETGKTLYLTGVLPPAQVTVELDVKAKR